MICSEKPTSVSSSAAFIIDLKCLLDVDDIKRDSYGKWNYSGSRSQFFLIKAQNEELIIEKRSPGCTDDNVYELRRLYCTHPSNSNFRRMIATLTGILLFYILHAIKWIYH